MLTQPTTSVDGAPSVVMWSIKQIHERDRVSKQAVSKKVKELVEKHGLAVERDGQGRIAAVNVVQYDLLRKRFNDPAKAQAPKPEAAAASAPQPQSETYEEARRQATWHEAERRRLELEEIRGKLIRVDRLSDAVLEIGGDINLIIDRLPTQADELAATVGRDGPHGLRVALKQLAVKMREDIAEKMAVIAERAPKIETEPKGETTDQAVPL